MTTALNPFLPLLAGRVRRYHVQGELFPQSVAEHCWRAAILLLQIYPSAPAPLIIAVLEHDSGEWWAGDTPAPVKWASPLLKTTLDAAETHGARAAGVSMEPDMLSDSQWAMVRFVDYLELAIYMLERGSQGIVAARPIYEKVIPLVRHQATTMWLTDETYATIQQVVAACEAHAAALWPAGSPDLSMLCLPVDLDNTSWQQVVKDFAGEDPF